MYLPRVHPRLIGLAFALLETAGIAQESAAFITRFTASGDLTWTNVIPGERYAIECSGSPSSGWTNFLPAMTATGATMSVNVPTSSGSAFYRVMDAGSCCTNAGGSVFENAVRLPEGCGDEQPQSQTLAGCGAAFYRVVVRECDFSFVQAKEVKARFRLQPPPNSDYDLYVYRPDGTLIDQSNNGGAALDWVRIISPDTIFEDNGFEVIVEVFRAGGYDCEAWQLYIEWNQG